MHPEDQYPGWEHQPLFDHMSEAHGLSLTKAEMDEIISAANKVTDRQIQYLLSGDGLGPKIIGEIKL